MRTLFDGREVESLDPKIARQISLPADVPLVEGVIISADEIIADTARRSRIVLGIMGGVIAAILIGVAIIALANDPGAMVIPGPLFLLILVGMAWGGPVLYRRNLAQMRDNTARRLARMAPPGTSVRLDGAGLTLGGRATPWSEITLECVEIVTEYSQEGDNSYSVQAVVLGVGGRSLVLDGGMITHGSAMIGKALRTQGYSGLK